MKGGITYANQVTTVSPHHAWEAHHTDVSYGLGHTLHVNRHKFSGILNGINYDFWNPEVDYQIPYHYTPTDLSGKTANKKALRDRLLLEDNDRPIVSFIGRLDQQKGVHLVHHSIYYSLFKNSQFVLLGSATEQAINDRFWEQKMHLNNNPNAHLEIGFDEELAHLIYAGADIIVVPSNFEPCGLTQLIGLKYGTVPVVRAVGGLVNTVFDRDHADHIEPEKRNGFVFNDSDFGGLESALGRAINLYYSAPKEFEQLAIQGMEYDNSWNLPGGNYEEIYDFIRHK